MKMNSKIKLLSLLVGITLVTANSVPVLEPRSIHSQGPRDRNYTPCVYSTISLSYYNINSDEFVNLTDKAKYGEGKILNVTGKLVHITSPLDMNDNSGCDENILGTNGNPLPSDPWIALIERGKCNFEDKVIHAYNHNAIGVIVYNDRESINLDKMKIIYKKRHITAVFTYKWVGEDFAHLVEEGKNVTVSLNKAMRGKCYESVIQ